MKLEDFIKEHSDDIFEATPPATHRDAMLSKLHHRRGGRTIGRWVVSISTAAAVIAFALMVLTPSDVTDNEPQTAIETELCELDLYYQNRRNESISTIEELLKGKDAAMQVEIRGQVAQIKNETTEDNLPPMLLTIDAEKYLALTVTRYEIQNDNLQTLINILNQ